MKEVAIYNSPVGSLLITSEGDAITEIHFQDANQAASSPQSEIMRKCFVELDEYFRGKRKKFTVKVNPKGTEFQKSVWKKLLQIPYGSTKSYEEMAISLGNQKKIRAVGLANGRNRIPIIIPCHRVIGKDGSLTGFGGGLPRKEFLLRLEGAKLFSQLPIF